jgi:hypothetical protein
MTDKPDSDAEQETLEQLITQAEASAVREAIDAMIPRMAYHECPLSDRTFEALHDALVELAAYVAARRDEAHKLLRDNYS